MAGILKIHSLAGSLQRPFGHSWLEFCHQDGTSTTYGTWGNNPVNRGDGLLENVELLMVSDVSRTRDLDDEAEQRFLAKIREYHVMGADAWTFLAPCSTFAADTWEHTFGEHLEHRVAGFSNPTRLVAAIIDANMKDLVLHQNYGPVHQPVKDKNLQGQPDGPPIKLDRSGTISFKARSKARRGR